MTRWWKCDLQVATPGEPRFVRPSHWSLSSPEGKAAAASEYMARAAAEGIEAVALADHNSVEWVDEMHSAGKEHGVVVFPGFELTTGSGADGVHLVVFAGPGTPASELRQVLYGCGFDHEHPLFNPARPDEPAPASKTLAQVLDGLPLNYLVVAPHAFNDNGVASPRSAKGIVRWRALHHPRLGAVDVGDARTISNDDAFRSRFVKRELDDFPCLPDLAFVATSDCYSLDTLGSRFTWIRMSEPTIEAMRQAFIDHEARIVCDWDSRYADTDLTPNSVAHAWVKNIDLHGISTASGQFSISFDPRLTVLIGGRGAGKSTVIAGLRCLYSDLASLPPGARQEAVQFQDAVLAGATVAATHLLAHSGEEQTATWTVETGSTTRRSDGNETPTGFAVRVVSQKELFERAAHAAGNPFATSQNLLALVDDALQRGGAGGQADAWASAVDEAQTKWVAAVRHADAERVAIAQRQQVSARVEELRKQVEAFDSDESRGRRERNDDLAAQARRYLADIQSTRTAIEHLRDEANRRLAQHALHQPDRDEADGRDQEFRTRLGEARRSLNEDLTTRAEAALAEVAAIDADRLASHWQSDVVQAEADHAAWLEELSRLGLDPTAYERVRNQLREQGDLLSDLEQRAEQLPDLNDRASGDWAALQQLFVDRRSRREALLAEVSERSGELRFTLHSQSDEAAWVAAVRQILNLRSDGFLEEVPALGTWLWKAPEAKESRLAVWRTACITGDFEELSRAAGMRSAWTNRLRGLDPLVRARLAAEVADDVVALDFLREGGAPANVDDWQPLTTGSPGQRSAAMLGFVLHHGEEPLVLDQPEDDLDTEWISQLVVRQLRRSRWVRQVIIVTHNANIPVNADAERVVVVENVSGGIRVRYSEQAGGRVEHCGPIENKLVRADIQQIMEGGVDAFVRRERKYNNELNTYRAALHQLGEPES